MPKTTRELFNDVLENASSVIFGQDEMLRSILSAIVCEGHILIEGMPGLGKTLSVSTMANLMNLDFQRIQFTPDLLPSDLIGTKIFSQKNEEFTTKFGPIFTQLLLADEINRSPAKVQSALLESMAERQVTIGEQSYPLKRPFVVMATQNPIEQEGTYPLPEAQLDRFMVKVSTDYPSEEAELRIITETKESESKTLGILDDINIKNAKEEVESIFCDEKIMKLIVRIVQRTRPSDKNFSTKFKSFIHHGASPRATIWLYKLSKINAFFEDRDYVIPEDVLKNVVPVLGHRVALTYEAKLDGVKTNEMLNDLALGTM